MNEKIEILNKAIVNDLNIPHGLAHGKMGLIIYLYNLYDYSKDFFYKNNAECLLNDLLEKDLSKNGRLTVEDGLCGVALGLDYIIGRKNVNGDINELLGDIDNLLFKQIAFGNPETQYSLSQLIHLLYYVYRRLESQTLDEDRFLFEELAIKLINKVADLAEASFFTESYTFSIYRYHVPILMKVLSCFMVKNFYQDRTIKILEQLSLCLFAHLPHLHLNRLYLLWGVLPLRVISPAWQQYADLLKSNVDLRIIYEREIKNRNIYISNGYSFLYFMLDNLNREYPEYYFNFDPLYIRDRIMSSDAWSALVENDYYYNIHRGLLNGFPGAVLALLDIKNKYS